MFTKYKHSRNVHPVALDTDLFWVHILIFRLKSSCKLQSGFWTVCFLIPCGHFQIFSQYTHCRHNPLQSSAEGSWRLAVKNLLVPSPGRFGGCFLTEAKSVVVSYMRQRQLTALHPEFEKVYVTLPGHCHTRAFQIFKQ